MTTAILIARTYQQADGTFTAKVIECTAPGIESPVLFERDGFASRAAAMKAAKAAKTQVAA